METSTSFRCVFLSTVLFLQTYTSSRSADTWVHHALCSEILAGERPRETDYLRAFVNQVENI